MSEKKELNQEQLEKVTGGDKGDAKKEGAFWSSDIKYLYNVNDEVEVYDNAWHTTTEHGTIIARRPKYVYDQLGYGDHRYVGEYQIHYRDKVAGYHTQDDWVTANEIES